MIQSTDGQSAAEAILSTAKADSADLIVIGLRRRSPVGKLITGARHSMSSWTHRALC